MRALFLLSLLCACALFSCSRRSSSQAAADAAPVAAENAPLSFELPRFPDGERVELSKSRGKVVLLDVWATWCDPCVDSLPAYAQLAREYADRGVEVYALSIDEDPQQIARFIEGSNLSLPILHDRGAEVAEQRLHVQRVPSTFVVDQRGVVRHRHEGFNAQTLTALKKQIDALLIEGTR